MHRMTDVTQVNAASDGLPRPSDLALSTRVAFELARAADLPLRTGLASIVATAGIFAALSPSQRRLDREQLDFYVDMASAGDAGKVFLDPDPDHEVVARRGIPTPGLSPGRVENLTFQSRFEALNPALRSQYASHKNNRTARFQHWKHRVGPRPTLLVIHGFGASPYWLNSAFFSLPWFYTQGYDVVLATLPFHGARASRTSIIAGQELFSRGFSTLHEAMFHAIHDLRVLLDHLFAEGTPRVGVTGLSLGGYTSALLSAVDDRLSFVIPNAAVTDMGSLTDTYFPANLALRTGMPLVGLDADAFKQATRVHSPLNYECLVPHSRRMIIAGLGDLLAPPVQSQMLWEHWDQPELHWFPGNHVLHVNRAAYLRKMGRFFNTIGFHADDHQEQSAA